MGKKMVRVRGSSASLFVFSLLFTNVVCLPANGQNLVMQTTHMSSARARPAIAFVGDKLLIIKGYDDWFSGRPTSIVDVYDLNTWAFMGTMTAPHASSSPKAAVIGSKVLVAGRPYIDIYDASTGLWSSVTQSESRDWLGVAVAGEKAFFAGGGYTGSKTVDVYDDKTGLWTTDSLSVGRTSLTATGVGTKVLFAGGYIGDSARVRSDVVDIFDTATNTWDTAHLSQARSHLTSVTVGNLAFFAGGSYVNGIDYTGSDVVDIYNDATGQWSVTHMPHARTVLAAAAVGAKALFAGGGYSTGVNYVDIYDTQTGQWTSMTLSTSRGWLGGGSNGLAAVFAGGKVNSSLLTSAVDIFTPEPATFAVLALGGLAVLRRRGGQRPACG